jgi:prepilin-type N-terminal cleavage/methylation domain-containing protein
MNKQRGGFTLMEMLIVVAIVAVLAGAGYNYYADILPEARENTARMNLKIVRDAISRYFKDNMAYPTSLKSLESYLQQPVETVLITPLGGDAKLRLEYNSSLDTVSFYERVYVWSDQELVPAGKQIRDVRIKLNGTEMPW